ncbi:MAG: hypothetical protein J5692_02090 [Bacteroidales bacterium]|nr:hypothetical protein [Bacteroidales bacterium]
MDTPKYNWTFASVGGAVRVKISSGEDIAHLGELDRKMWTVLSCPVTGLEFDEKTLKIIDRDADGKIRVDEVIATAQWITRILKNPDDLLKGASELPLDGFNAEDAEGATLKKSAKQILKNLGLKKDSISLEDTADNAKIFAGTPFNGDGIITAFSSEKLAELIGKIAAVTGGATDRSGETGVTADQIEAFYAACADYAAWKEALTKEALPYGDNTADALAAVEAVAAKVADFFVRCKLISFDADASGAVDVDVEKIKAISAEDLSAKCEDIALYPIARPNAKGVLPLAEGVNPAWQAAMAKVKALVFPKKNSVTEDEWNAALAAFGAYKEWVAAKKGAEVEALGLDDVKAILKADEKADLLKLIEKDKALEAEAVSIETVDKVLHLLRDFYSFLNNYVVLADFYDLDKKAIFQAGRLYIDQRSTDLCLKVAGPSPEISSLSGMYILYCACTSEKLGKSFNIAAVLTDGDVDGLREGKNAVFYDRAGNDYTAKVTAIVDNPISVRQAFWSPYKKVARMINDRIDKAAAEKNEKSMNSLTSATNSTADGKAPGEAIKSSFDIAKFAGIFAAVGMGLGMLGQMIVALAKGVAAIKFWVLILIIIGIMLVISGPAMFIAWRKLRKRDLGPVLNANGWAVNAKSLVRPKFGKTLTSLVKYPAMKDVDPETAKKVRRRRFWTWVIVILILAGGAFCGWKLYEKKQAAKAAAAEAAAVEAEAEAPAEAEAEVAVEEATEEAAE